MSKFCILDAPDCSYLYVNSDEGFKLVDEDIEPYLSQKALYLIEDYAPVFKCKRLTLKQEAMEWYDDLDWMPKYFRDIPEEYYG